MKRYVSLRLRISDLTEYRPMGTALEFSQNSLFGTFEGSQFLVFSSCLYLDDHFESVHCLELSIALRSII